MYVHIHMSISFYLPYFYPVCSCGFLINPNPDGPMRAVGCGPKSRRHDEATCDVRLQGWEEGLGFRL